MSSSWPHQLSLKTYSTTKGFPVIVGGLTLSTTTRHEHVFAEPRTRQFSGSRPGWFSRARDSGAGSFGFFTSSALIIHPSLNAPPSPPQVQYRNVDGNGGKDDAEGKESFGGFTERGHSMKIGR